MLNIRHAVLGDVNDLHDLYMKHLTQYPPKEPQDISKWQDLLKHSSAIQIITCLLAN